MTNEGIPTIPPVARAVHATPVPINTTARKTTGQSVPADGADLPPSTAAQTPAEVTAQAAVKAATKARLQPAVTHAVPATDPPHVSTASTATAMKSAANLHALVAQLNKQFNDSGQPDQFRLNAASGNQQIQVINPATGKVIGQYPATEFPALARGLRVTGLVIDSLA